MVETQRASFVASVARDGAAPESGQEDPLREERNWRAGSYAQPVRYFCLMVYVETSHLLCFSDHLLLTSTPHQCSRHSALVSWQARQGWRSARIGSGRPVEGKTTPARWVIRTVCLSLLRAALHAESCVCLRHNVLRAFAGEPSALPDYSL